MARKVLLAYVVCAVTHLVCLAAGVMWLEWTTKAALMPLLAAWVWRCGGPRLVISALLLSACGDVALQFDHIVVFMVGMLFFAAAHVCYVTYFVRAGAGASLRRRWPVVVLYAVVWCTLITILWPGLGDLRFPVAGYSLLLTATAITSAAYGLRSGVGGGLFLISDALIAAHLAGLNQPPYRSLWVMATYMAAQYLLASATVTNRSRGSDMEKSPYLVR